MRCYYVYDKIAGKVLISGCWGTVHSKDMADCYCQSINNKSNEERIFKLESEIKQLKNQIKILNADKTDRRKEVE